MPQYRTLPLLAVLAFSMSPQGADAHQAPLLARAVASEAVTAVRYDRDLDAVVVSFRGCIPSYTVGKLMNIPCRYLDFKAPTPLGVIGQRTPGHPLLSSWALARRSATVTRVSLTFRRDTKIRIVPDPERNRLLIFPYTGAAMPPEPVLKRPSPTPSPTPAPVQPPEKEAAAPAPVSPVPSIGPRSWPIPTPSPSASASLNPAFRVRTSMGWMNYRENFLSGDTLVQVAGVPVPGFGFDYRFPAPEAGWVLPGWYGGTLVSTASYAFRDRDLPVSIHARQEWRGETYLARRLGWPNLNTELGLGYMVRYETATHSGAPPEPSYLFSQLRLFHGPELRAAVSWRLAEDWPVYLEGARIFGEAGLAPYIFSTLDSNLSPLPPLAAGRAEYGIEHRMGPVGFRISYRTWWTGSFGGYEEMFQGPVISLTSSSSVW